MTPCVWHRWQDESERTGDVSVIASRCVLCGATLRQSFRRIGKTFVVEPLA